MKTKRNKINVIPEKKDDMTSSNQTPGGYKFAPHVASQQWRVTQHESASFGIPSPWSFPSRSGIRLHPVVHPWHSLQRFISSSNFQPLVPPSCSFPLVLGCIRPLVGIDAESAEVVQETLYLLFFLAPHTARATQQFSEHHALRQFRILHARHKSRKQGPPPCVKSPRCLTFRFDKRVHIGNRMVGAIVLSPTDAASQEPVVGSAQCVVVARGRAPCDAAALSRTPRL